MTATELGSVVSRSLIMLQKKHPGIGWVRGDLVPSQEASLEILELRKQIESLESKLEKASTQAPPGTEKLSQREKVFVINYKCSSSKAYQSYSWTKSIEVTWDDIFYWVSPLMIHEASDFQLRQSLDSLVKSFGMPELEDSKEGNGHSFSSFHISDEDFQTIKVQLRALGLIIKNDKNRSIKDNATYWTLTPYGDSVMNRLRAIKI